MGNGRPSMEQGLTSKEAAARLRKLGPPAETSSRSMASIVAGNVFTLFNAIIGAFFVLDIGLGLYADSIFGLIAVVNSSIGIYQEKKAKETLDDYFKRFGDKIGLVQLSDSVEDNEQMPWGTGLQDLDLRIE